MEKWIKNRYKHSIVITFTPRDAELMDPLSSDIQDLKNCVVLVDDQDQPIGVCDKLQAHEDALLHRAFSIMIFRQHQGKVQALLQKRAVHKYHSAGLWGNSCCSHPHPDEDLHQAATRRLQEELGFKTPLHHAGSFIYKQKLGSLSEHEYDHVFFGWMDFKNSDQIAFDAGEVADVRWQDINHLQIDLQNNPESYVVWLPQVLAILSQHSDLSEIIL